MFISLQKLQELVIGGDNIGSHGAQHFATMLRDNEVDMIIFSSYVATTDLFLYL